MNTSKPFPSQIEIIRAIAVVLETKKPMARFLDDSKKNFLAAGREEIHYLLDEVVRKPLKDKLSPLTSEVLFELFDSYIYEYIHLVRETNADGLTRDEILVALSNHVVSEFWVSLTQQVHSHYSVPERTLIAMCSVESSALQIVSKLIGSEYNGGYDEWLKHAKKTLKYYHGDSVLYKYHLCEYRNHSDKSLPSQQSIYRLFTEELMPESDLRVRSTALLTLARVLDLVKRIPILKESLALAFVPEYGLSDVPLTECFKCINCAIGKKGVRTDKLQMIYDQLEIELSLTNRKDNDAAHRALLLLDEAGSVYKLISKKTPWRLDRSHYYRARFSTLYGDLTCASKHYRCALQQAIYGDGPLLRKIIEEGYCVGARAGKGSSVELKKLKIAAISLCFDGTAVHHRKPFSNNKDDYLQIWEVQEWAAQFDQLFKSEFMFKNANVSELSIEPWFLIKDRKKGHKFNPRYKDAPKKIGKGITHTSRQLIISIQKKEYEQFKKLMCAGANVNAFNDHGATPLIAALHNMNPVLYDDFLENEKYIGPLLDSVHDIETLRSYDHLFMDTALSASINTGQYRLVKTVVEMLRSASIEECTPSYLTEGLNKRVTQYHATPLFYVLQLIGGVKHRDKLPTLKQGAYCYDVNQLRKIAILLIECGANASTRELDQSLPGFNSFWLAILLDESEIFSKMLDDVGSETPLIDLTNCSACTPIQYAQQNSAEECLVLLQDKLNR